MTRVRRPDFTTGRIGDTFEDRGATMVEKDRLSLRSVCGCCLGACALSNVWRPMSRTCLPSLRAQLRSAILASSLLLSGASMMGCASESAAAAHQPRTALLVGVSTSTARVLIKSVDDGPTLWANQGALGRKVSIIPGRHKVAVMCEIQDSRLLFVPGDVTIDVQAGQIYDLVGSLAQGARRCDVSASSRGPPGAGGDVRN